MTTAVAAASAKAALPVLEVLALFTQLLCFQRIHECTLCLLLRNLAIDGRTTGNAGSETACGKEQKITCVYNIIVLLCFCADAHDG